MHHLDMSKRRLFMQRLLTLGPKYLVLQPEDHAPRPNLFIALVSLVLTLSTSFAETPAKPHHPTRLTSVPTEIRIESTPWWPTSGVSDRKEYVGSATCGKCHAEKAVAQAATSMGRAATRASDSEQLRSHPDLALRLGSYTYNLVTKGGKATLSVSNGAESMDKNLEWALGDGNFGQSYVYREQGKYYESQLSFYTRLNALDTTTGHMEPKTLETAAGGLTPPDSIRQCFACHFTASTTNNRFDPDAAIAGVTCEACHGPGAQHATLMTLEARDAKGLAIDTSRLRPADSVDFCGACHRTSADVILSGLSKMGVINVRLQPYRLEKSKCWGGGDARVTCVACHDPHVQVVRNAGFYDTKCLQCHTRSGDHPTTARLIAGCKVGTKDCVTCHMPKIEVPGTHTTFTDHWIRIDRGNAYPD
jgi:hypothetical protein